MSLQIHEDTLRHLSKTKAVLLFLFRKRSFIRLSTEHDTAQSIVGAEDIRQAFLEGKYKPNLEYTRQLAEERTSELRQSLRQAFIAVVCSAFIAGFSGFILYRAVGPCPPWLSSLLQLTGVAVILWATIWELGWNVRSMDGSTLPERVHQWVFRLMYIIGSACFFFAYVWATNWQSA